MKISSFIIFTILTSQGLLGCNAFNAGQNEQNAHASSKGKDTCGRRQFKRLIGTAFDEIYLRDDFSREYDEQRDDGSGVWKWKNKTYFLRVFDPRPFFLTGEDQVVLANYSSSRLNVSLDKDGIIESLKCG